MPGSEVAVAVQDAAPVGLSANEADAWDAVNRALVAKTISELSYEEAFAPTETGPGEHGGAVFELVLKSGVRYRFQAWRRIWTQLDIDAGTLCRVDAGGLHTPLSAAQFFLDAAAETEMTPATLATYLRELYSTCAADMRIAAVRQGLSVGDFLDMAPGSLQSMLSGHPKAPASKGRIGWGVDDFEMYAPEHGTVWPLTWLAVSRDHCRFSLKAGMDMSDLVDASLDTGERSRLEALMRARGLDPASYLPVPVHPWQWQNHLRTAYGDEIAAGRIVWLGPFGDRYRPQISLRTMTNEDRPGRLDVKLALTILNTSAYRGIPGKYIAIGPRLSAWLSGLCRRDPVLSSRNVQVLEEVAGAFYPHPAYDRIDGAPYQFQELLGVIWRENVFDDLGAGETAMLMATLMEEDDTGRPFISEIIARSGLEPDAWLERLFEAVLVPLYHLMCRYGIGTIAHGQNITLVLRDWVPSRLALKDFQGDFALVDMPLREWDDLDADILAALPRKPALHILHDLLTAHFVTVLRFISAGLARRDGYDEQRFYRICATVLARYRASHPDLRERFALFDILAPTVKRVCINRARFRIGYGDSPERPLPIVGTDLANPLHLCGADSAAHPSSTES
ncbi:IucA/IucC family protein [Eilatimonas milleporae]|uniref:Aerobactin synthase n=1 Tax=Eilatimonas milleporae TaxID=911205 RepID=A0A3M0CRB3_9PROT|nr:IucA/IucC family siderophore biosynthesis protein [Eilatimonas milleporae]RMB12094.1 aerobactin synthase [Eilatimonas milleporae]